MTHCPQTERIQRALDRELPAAEAHEFEEHLAGCALCARESALYARVFESLAAAPGFDPPAALTERILDRVLPARARRRWVRAAGWVYAGALAAMALALAGLLAQPVGRHALIALWADASRGVAAAMVLALEALGWAVLGLAGWIELLERFGSRLAPLGRAGVALAEQPALLGALGVALAASVVVLWWMRPREARANRGVPHVGLLGF